jgi:ribosomal protein S18 acetylase RimI-like enzyme
MLFLREITGPHGPTSDVVRQLADVLCSAREERLRFLVDLHTREESKRYLSEVVLPANQTWLAQSNVRIVGFIAFADGWLNHLYIAKDFQRQGLGSRLLTIAKQASTTLRLWVFEINTPAIRFYESHGFKIIERTDGSGNEANMPDALMEWSGQNEHE